MKLHIVLLEPEIPQNTGNISRTCAAIGADLHLIEPMGFKVSEKEVKRAGLDYWDKLRLHHYTSLDEFATKTNAINRMWFLSTKSPQNYFDANFSDDENWFMFGKESAGIPEAILRDRSERCLRIPMLPAIRSLNLSNSVAVVAFEVLRQKGFPGFALQGILAEQGKEQL